MQPRHVTTRVLLGISWDAGPLLLSSVQPSDDFAATCLPEMTPTNLKMLLREKHYDGPIHHYSLGHLSAPMGVGRRPANQ